MKRLVLLVEADGDVQAVPSLVGRLLAELPETLQGQLFLDNAPMKVGGLHQITGKRKGDLARHLGNAAKRPKLVPPSWFWTGMLIGSKDSSFCAEHRRGLSLNEQRKPGPERGSPLPWFSFGKSTSRFCSRQPTSFQA